MPSGRGSPRSVAPCRRAIVSAILTANTTRCRPSVLGGGSSAPRDGGRRVNTWQAPAYRVSHTYCVQICVQAILTIQCIDRRGCIYWSRPSDLNRRPFDYESNALPTELGRLEWWKCRRTGTKAEFQNILFRIGLCQGSGRGERTPFPPSDKIQINKNKP